MNEAEEVWRPVVGNAYYEVSDHGRVRSLSRVIPYVDGRDRPLVGRMRKPVATSGHGYLHVYLHPEKKLKYVHRLVAMAFVHGWEEGLVVNHNDGDKKNNAASNLEWVTYKENSIHARDVLMVAFPPKPSTVSVIGTNVATGEEMVFEKMDDTKPAGFNPAQVCNCCRGRNLTHRGFAWRYADASRA